MRCIIAIGFGLVILLQVSISAQQFTAEQFLNSLGSNQAKIRTLSADFQIVIDTAGKPMIQKGRYVVDNDKGLSLMEITEPVKQVLLSRGTDKYVKGDGAYKKLEKPDDSMQFGPSADILQYSFLSQFKYELSDSDEAKGIYRLDGYQGDQKKLTVIYDVNAGVVSQYTIMGNETMPYITVMFEYRIVESRELSVESQKIQIPIKITTRVKAGVATVTSSMVMRNVRVNENVNESEFK